MSGFELFRHFYKLIEYFFSRKCHLEFSSIISRLNGHITPLFIIIIIITSIFGHLAHQRPSTPLQLCAPGPCLQASLVLLNAQGSVQSSLVL